jgi:1-pyrroline-5-carboxylate dehydrogenase
MGNTVLWKPAASAMLSAYYIMKLLEEAGLPPGVINFVPGDPVAISDVALAHRDLAGVHFTGSTGVFNSMWKKVGENMGRYKTYPRLVGETGGKDFVIAHPSADPQEVAVALARGAFEYQGQKCSAASRTYIPQTLWNDVRDRLVAMVKDFIIAHPSADPQEVAVAIARGGFEYQGQKCSAASRVYVPRSLWPTLKDRLVAIVEQIRMGDVTDFTNFMGAVIDQRSFTKISGYLDDARKNATVISGGVARGNDGWFIEPTVVETADPGYRLLCEEIFGPVVTVHVYDDARWAETLRLVDTTSPYALTGAVFATDRRAVREAMMALRNAAGNFYVNDKPTGAVVGQQPFGGARGSGTNDKAGSKLNLVRWISARSIKETFSPPTDWRYPFMSEA